MREITCPYCHYHGKPRRKARGSRLVALFLMLFFILPGIFYLMFKSGYRYYCPSCGMQLAVDN